LVPPWPDATMVDRERLWAPMPHDLLQAPQASQPLTSQSIGHAKVLQAREERRLGQTLPPWAEGVVTARVWLWAPEPQVRLQADQADQALTTQSTAQLCSLQLRVTERAGQATPPKAEVVVTSRVWLWDPLPQERLQVDQADQADTTQSMGHAWVLQAWDWASSGQTAPPWTGFTEIVRLRVWVPAPQDNEQRAQGDHLETWQFTGQAWVLHS